MQSLKEYRSTKVALPDLLNWAAVIDNGVVLNKDGSLMAGWYYRGQDLAIVSNSERNIISAKINAALGRLGSEWVLHQDAIRIEARSYPNEQENSFPDPISKLIEAERREYFQAQGKHFESIYALVVTYLPAKAAHSKVVDLFFEDGTEKGEKVKKVSPGDQALMAFQAGISELEDNLSGAIELTRMRGLNDIDEDERKHTDDQLLQYLHYSLSGLSHPVKLPPCPMYLDSIIGGHEFWGGLIPKLEDKFIQTVSIDGFPSESYPGILASLDEVPVKFRWNTRFIFQDTIEAQGGLKSYKRKWQQKVRGFWDQVFHSEQTSKSAIDYDAQAMVAETENAIAEASSGLVTYGYYSSTIVLMDECRETLEEASQAIKKTINNLGFTARLETVNTIEAWLGSLPGHTVQNIRRPMLHTMHLADMLPLASVWAGSEIAPCPDYPKNSPALMYADTLGSTPFRFNFHIDDVGHTLMLGPTGAGKSTVLALAISQAMRYEGMTVYAFDKGCALEPVTKALNGAHYDITADNDICFSPLADIDDPETMSWAYDWVCGLLMLQEVDLTSNKRNKIHEALITLRDSPSKERTLTNLKVNIQDAMLKDALGQYTSGGSYSGIIDAVNDNIDLERICCFEIGGLMSKDDRIAIPVLLYLFHIIEKSLKGQPCLLFLDEAWLMLKNPVFKEKIVEWLKVLRKANCSVIFATQSVTDAIDSGLLGTLSDNCPTKIFLANPAADNEGNITAYKALGCSAPEMMTIKHMTRKRDYFIKGEGRRKVSFSFAPIALSFCGAGGKSDLKRIRELEAEHGKQWPYVWLKERKVRYEHLQ